MSVKKVVVILGLIFGTISCSTPTKYFVKSESELLQIDFERNMLNFLPLLDIDLKKSTVLDSTYKLLVLRKYSKLDKYLSSVKFETQDFYLAKTLYFVSKTEYTEAANYLRKINEEQYPLLRELLFIDLSYELTKSSNPIIYKQYLQKYQELIDKYPDNEYLKRIVALRTRYIRYNY